MVTLFRYEGRGNGEAGTHGHQLLLATLRDSETSHRCETWVEPVSVVWAAQALRSVPAFRTSPGGRALLHELDHQGPPGPVAVRALPPDFRSDPLTVDWEAFTLRQTEHGWRLGFREPGPDGQPVELDLEPESSPVVVPGKPGMDYRSSPRISLRGSRDHLSLTGMAWMDHQWGDQAWMVDESGKSVFGWDWFGLNCDDGSDWIIIRHRDARTGEIEQAQAWRRGPDGRAGASTDVVLTKLRHWESPRTRIRHPVAWRIDLPAFGASFEFTPRADDQELAVLGPARAVWEGSGTVRGTVEGRAVSGSARGEFHGYGYLFDPQQMLASFTDRIDERLRGFLPRRFGHHEVERFVGPPAWRHTPGALTECVSRPLWDLLDRKKKCWRPLFGLLLLESFGVPSGPYEELLAVMAELIHSAALIVDDIEDDSRLRRGDEYIHLRYGTAVALNAANLLFFLPSVVLMEHPVLPPEKKARLHELKERVGIEAHFGQAVDLHWSHHLTESNLAAWMAEGLEEQILQMYAYKTGAATTWMAESAILLADQPEAVRAPTLEFARRFAVAFQVVDDIHDCNRSSKWTKEPGEDLANGKPTYVMARALRKLDPAAAAKLGAILCDPVRRHDPAARRDGLDLVRASGALAECRDWARREMTDGWAAFSRVVPPSEPKILLHAMCQHLLDLVFED